MAPPRRRRQSAAARRVRHLIVLDAANVMRRLTDRLGEMVTLFSRLRDRGPLISVIQSWFSTITFGELAELEPREQRVVNDFYELLGELRWHLTYTEDMPLQLQRRIEVLAGQLAASQKLLVAVLGPPASEGAPPLEVERVARPAEVPVALEPPKRRRAVGRH